MFDLDRQVKLKQARNALKDGRLDEAFTIAIEKDVRELRPGQVLLEDLVGPLLERAEKHLAGGKLREALVDTERAIAAGGQRPDSVSLRGTIEEAMAERRRAQRRGEVLAASVRRHIEEGDLEAGQRRLEDGVADASTVGRLKREIGDLQRRALQARSRASEHIQRGHLLEALAAVRDAVDAGGGDAELDELVARITREATGRIEESVHAGELEAARELLRQLRLSPGRTLESIRFAEAIELCDRAACAVARGEWEEARVALGRCETIVPEASWVAESLRQLEAVADGLRGLRSGPLGSPASGGEVPPGDMSGLPETPATPPQEAGEARASTRMLLWVDGVGTFLILTGERTSIGRAGSSSRPDIAASCDLAGYHAEIVRSEEDYFLVGAQGDVTVGGRPLVERRLLIDGDSVELGSRLRFSFRLPTRMSTTAVLGLRGGQRLEGDVRHVILLDEHLLIGPTENCHVRAEGCLEPVVLSHKHGRLLCRAKDEILVAGKPGGKEVSIPLGQPIRIGELTFTFTSLNDERS